MKNRLLINLLLALLVITLSLVAWLKPGQDKDQKTSISSLDIAAINTIRIARKDASFIELKRQANRWQLTQPIKAPALTGKVERLLKISQIEAPVSYALDRSSLNQFGLNPPTVQLSFNQETFNIGSTESVHSRRYVSNNEQLFMLDDTFLHLLTAPVNTYIDTRLLPDDIQITHLQTPQITLQKADDNTWRNLNAPADELSSDTVQMLLDEWRFARAITVSTQAYETADGIVTLSFKQHPKMRFKLIQQKDDIILISQQSKLAYRFSSVKYNKMTTLPTLDNSNA